MSRRTIWKRHTGRGVPFLYGLVSSERKTVADINKLLMIMITTLICKIPPTLPLSAFGREKIPKGGITPSWPPAHRASGPEGKEGRGGLITESFEMLKGGK